MGFIDYQRTKEDRYSVMLDYVKTQQEEDQRRIQDEKTKKWLSETMNMSQYVETNVPDLIKFIMVRYRNLSETKDEIFDNCNEGSIDASVLWNDFCIHFVSCHIAPLHLQVDRQETYYNTIINKVIKLDNSTSWKNHSCAISTNNSYKDYFAHCFDIGQEKQFWKWIGSLEQNDNNRLISFVDTYEELSVLLGYYLYFMARPGDDEWMQRLEIEKKVLDRIKADYIKGRLRKPIISKLRNPLYESDELIYDKHVLFDEREKERIKHGESQGDRRPMLDRVKFSHLLQGQELMDYVEACKLIKECSLPEKMDLVFQDLILKIPILQETIQKFDDVYHADLFQLKEYYMVEALQLSSTYLEYLNVGIRLEIIREVEDSVYDAVQALIVAIEDKINEIYQYGSMELKARSKALESLMNQDGHVKPAYKLN